MNKFTSSLLGAFTGTWLAFLFAGALILFFGFALVSSMADSVTTTKGITDNTILRIDFSGQINDKPYNRSLQEIVNGQNEVGEDLQTILKSIDVASHDDRIKGIYLNCCGASMAPATVYTIQKSIIEFKKSGKWVVAYGHELSQADYYAASAATKIYLNPAGTLDIHGLNTSILFYKDLMEKVGVDMQIIRVGTYKSAVEPYMLSHMSDANRLQTQAFLDNIWSEAKTNISKNRGVKPETIQEFADSLGSYKMADYALDKKLVDGVKYEHEALEELCKLVEVDNIDQLEFVSPSDVVNSTNDDNSSSNKIAVIYAEGEINVSGDETTINSDDLVPQILQIANDDDIKGLVLRVNSPGGSAFASEQIWEALDYLKKKGKTFAVSMGDYAASGGYYISCGAQRIFAQPTTITGSIGIFGMIPCVKKLANDKLGVNADFVSTSQNSNMSVFEPLTPTQLNAIQIHVNHGYETFVKRCADGRNLPTDSIKAIAEGRVWDGKSALAIHLIDEFGGVDDAIAWVAKTAKLDDYEVVNYPEFRMDFINLLYLSLDNSAKIQLNGNSTMLNEQIDKIQKLLNQDRLQCRMEELYVY